MNAILSKKLYTLTTAVNFLEKCKNDPSSWETGAIRDAREWVESAAYDVAKEWEANPISVYDPQDD